MSRIVDGGEKGGGGGGNGEGGGCMGLMEGGRELGNGLYQVLQRTGFCWIFVRCRVVDLERCKGLFYIRLFVGGGGGGGGGVACPGERGGETGSFLGRE